MIQVLKKFLLNPWFQLAFSVLCVTASEVFLKRGAVEARHGKQALQHALHQVFHHWSDSDDRFFFHHPWTAAAIRSQLPLSISGIKCCHHQRSGRRDSEGKIDASLIFRRSIDQCRRGTCVIELGLARGQRKRRDWPPEWFHPKENQSAGDPARRRSVASAEHKSALSMLRINRRLRFWCVAAM